MKIHQQAITLSEKKRGFHLITKEVVNSLQCLHEIKVGVCHVFIQHTSASLCINENDPDYIHDTEGGDDMPAHLKAALLGSSVMIPVSDGKLTLGIWQGIYLCEHRNYGGRRNLIITAWGD